jgi:hypothetical protein
MTKPTKKQVHDKRRAAKHKHEHQTEHMQEEAAKHKRSRREEIVTIVIIVCLLPFLLTGFFFFPSSTVKTNTGIEDGSYTATIVSTRPAGNGSPASAVIDVNGGTFIVNESDFSGKATMNTAGFFELKPGQNVNITVKDGYITSWSAQ